MQETKQAQGKDGAVKVVDTIAIGTDGRLHVNLGVGKGTPSSTGKSTIHASTHGFVDIEGTSYKINLTLIKKA